MFNASLDRAYTTLFGRLFSLRHHMSIIEMSQFYPNSVIVILTPHGVELIEIDLEYAQTGVSFVHGTRPVRVYCVCTTNGIL